MAARLDHPHGDMAGSRRSSVWQPGATIAPSGVSINSSPSPEVAAISSSLLWPGVVLAILAAIGLFAGFGFDYLAGHKR